MPRILDTLPAFQEFARRAFLEAPAIRETIWEEVYAGAHPEVFACLHDRFGDGSLAAVVRDLSRIRRRVEQGHEVIGEVIEEVDPAVAELLDTIHLDPGPLHVLLVGTLATNAFVDSLDGDVAVFHCLEWYTGRGSTRVLTAHEDTHAWHRLLLPDQPQEAEDLLWALFVEGMAIQVSRRLAPDQPEEYHFFYGVEGFEEWLPWCRDNHDMLLAGFRDALDAPEEDVYTRYFGGGFVEGHWRVGFYLADAVVGGLGREPAELARMRPAEAHEAVRRALDA